MDCVEFVSGWLGCMVVGCWGWGCETIRNFSAGRGPAHQVAPLISHISQSRHEYCNNPSFPSRCSSKLILFWHKKYVKQDPILLWASYFHLLCLRSCRSDIVLLLIVPVTLAALTPHPTPIYPPPPTPSFTFSMQMFATDISICFQVPHATQAPNIPKRMIVVPLFRQIGML